MGGLKKRELYSVDSDAVVNVLDSITVNVVR